MAGRIPSIVLDEMALRPLGGRRANVAPAGVGLRGAAAHWPSAERGIIPELAAIWLDPALLEPPGDLFARVTRATTQPTPTPLMPVPSPSPSPSLSPSPPLPSESGPIPNLAIEVPTTESWPQILATLLQVGEAWRELANWVNLPVARPGWASEIPEGSLLDVPGPAFWEETYGGPGLPRGIDPQDFAPGEPIPTVPTRPPWAQFGPFREPGSILQAPPLQLGEPTLGGSFAELPGLDLGPSRPLWAPPEGENLLGARPLNLSLDEGVPAAASGDVGTPGMLGPAAQTLGGIAGLIFAPDTMSRGIAAMNTAAGLAGMGAAAGILPAAAAALGPVVGLGAAVPVLGKLLFGKDRPHWPEGFVEIPSQGGAAVNPATGVILWYRGGGRYELSPQTREGRPVTPQQLVEWAIFPRGELAQQSEYRAVVPEIAERLIQQTGPSLAPFPTPESVIPAELRTAPEVQASLPRLRETAARQEARNALEMAQRLPEGSSPSDITAGLSAAARQILEQTPEALARIERPWEFITEYGEPIPPAALPAPPPAPPPPPPAPPSPSRPLEPSRPRGREAPSWLSARERQLLGHDLSNREYWKRRGYTDAEIDNVIRARGGIVSGSEARARGWRSA